MLPRAFTHLPKQDMYQPQEKASPVTGACQALGPARPQRPAAHAHVSPQLSHRAREIFSKFLCSKATTPVNIDSQAQLADDILSAPHPDMFKEQQLQVTLRLLSRRGPWPGRAGGQGEGQLPSAARSGERQLRWEEPSRPLGLGLRAWQRGEGPVGP